MNYGFESKDFSEGHVIFAALPLCKTTTVQLLETEDPTRECMQTYI